ncbi:MAG TPA: hypothetical protein VGQ42_03980 [Candidatus Dormibacteraeota bacterium]|jgi:hypothetical protein|nr:hypothetical protein [Candidatus Dormibacteraeota bacterium]
MTWSRILSLLLAPAVALATVTLQAVAAVTPVAATSSSNPCGSVPKLVRSDFPDKPRIDNRFMPMVPGTQFLLDGVVLDDLGNPHPHRIETTVTDLTKVIDGVRTMVIFDRDIQDGVLTESEIFFLAQDRDGAVWLLGEYPELYDAGSLTGAPSTWISGVDGAHAGIAMPAHPRTGTPVYIQGLARSVGFFDCASVYRTGKHTCVATGCYDGVLITDEFAPPDPLGGHQRKYYAPGVGNIRVAAAGGVDPEALQLTGAGLLCHADFAAVRSDALKQDKRAYKVASAVYDGTPHAKDTLPDPRVC